MMFVKRMKLRHQIRGLGDGHLRDIGTSSSNVRSLICSLNVDRPKLKFVEQQSNSTLQFRHHSMHQLCDKDPGFVVTSFTPL